MPFSNLAGCTVTKKEAKWHRECVCRGGKKGEKEGEKEGKIEVRRGREEEERVYT